MRKTRCFVSAAFVGLILTLNGCISDEAISPALGPYIAIALLENYFISEFGVAEDDAVVLVDTVDEHGRTSLLVYESVGKVALTAEGIPEGLHETDPMALPDAVDHIATLVRQKREERAGEVVVLLEEGNPLASMLAAWRDEQAAPPLLRLEEVAPSSACEC